MRAFLEVVRTCDDAPDGNTILHMFGAPLFEAVFLNRQGSVQQIPLPPSLPPHFLNCGTTDHVRCIFAEMNYCSPLLAHALNSFEEGTAVAIQALCDVFATCYRSYFSQQYLAAFYHSLKVSLSPDVDPKVLASALNHSKARTPPATPTATAEATLFLFLPTETIDSQTILC